MVLAIAIVATWALVVTSLAVLNVYGTSGAATGTHVASDCAASLDSNIVIFAISCLTTIAVSHTATAVTLGKK